MKNMKDAYESFAKLYDQFMEEIPYDQWLLFLEQIWQTQGVQIQTIADLGCGTGNMLVPLAQKGYHLIGVDLSFDMLAQAEQKLRYADCHAVLLEQDLTNFSLPEQADCILSVCDSLNYLIEDGELSAAFACVKRFLKPDGIFCFDMNTVYQFENIYADHTFAATAENAAYIWENYYDIEEKINEYAVTFFWEDVNGKYQRAYEEHFERAYDIEEVQNALEENGLMLCGMFDNYTDAAPHAVSQRILFVAKHRQ